MAEHYTIALAGNPNCGKTTIFNHLTGMHQHVGNWPGKTVEKKHGTCRFGEVELTVVDLPGTYSLSAYSQEEIIARDYIIHEKPDVVVCVLDATNLERNLFLTAQVLELNVPVVIALNMSDLLESSGLNINTVSLAEALRSPVIFTAANREQGIDDLLETVVETARNSAHLARPEQHPHDAPRGNAADADCPACHSAPAPRHPRQFGRRLGERVHAHARSRDHAHVHAHFSREKHRNRQDRQHMLAYTHPQRFMVDYGREIEQEIVELSHVIEAYPELEAEFPTRWLAIKLLEQDEEIAAHIQAVPAHGPIFTQAEQSLAHLRGVYQDEVDTLFADRRYGWINGLVHEVITRAKISRLQLSDEIDKFVTHRSLGYVIFFFIMWVVFKFSTDIAAPFSGWIEGVFTGPFAQWVMVLLEAVGLENTWVQSFLLNGIIGGVGGVLAFVPILFFLYLCLAILEDSGYMARAAFLMDKSMHKLGLHGKSFLPMVLGFGCTVPALYGTRTMKSQRDRILVGLLVPFMSCSAKLPVYVIIASIFFPQQAGLVIFALYMLGVAVAFALGLLLKRTLFQQDEISPFVMELPPYRMPTLKSIWLHTWERTSAFIQKAWTIILAASIIIWLLLSTPMPGSQAVFDQVPVEESVFAGVSQMVAPALEPVGIGSWQSAGALITGVFGKEIIVSTYAQIYNTVPDAPAANTTTFWQDIGAILVSFFQAAWDTLKSIPMVIGINLFDGANGEDTALAQVMQTSFAEVSGGHGKLAAFALLVFSLLYTPCLVALNAERQELGWRWMLVTAFGQLGLAWLVSAFIFQAGKLLGLG